MQLQSANANIFIPDNSNIEQALSRTTHLAIAAHHDDLEIFAASAIAQCFHKSDMWFTGVVVTDGINSPRNSSYAKYSDAEINKIRTQEQHKAAIIGQYSVQICLNVSSVSVKQSAQITHDLQQILLSTSPKIVLTHNLADKHDTHVAVALRVITALQQLGSDKHPSQVLGCEVWRDLDWLLDSDKVHLDCSTLDNLQTALLGVFDSQISGGKRYDLATMGRRRANATFSNPNSVDIKSGSTTAMDLLPLIKNKNITPAQYIEQYIHKFASDVLSKIENLGTVNGD